MFDVGVNIGALTVKVVALEEGRRNPRVVAHQGRPQEVLDSLLAEPEYAGAASYGVSGPRGPISEVCATQRALLELTDEFDAVTSLGGESFLVYILAQGRITNVMSHNKCAAGSGEFLMQQIGRMGLDVESAVRRSFDGEIVPLAARCSVHCKSDITHKLNRKEARVEDILRTLHDSMADKVVSLLEKGQGPLGRVLVIGGVARNAAMLAALRGKLPETEFVVLPESPWFEAWGCALLARDEPRAGAPDLRVASGLGTLPPLSRAADMVTIIAAPPRQLAPDGPLVLGVDAGSTTTKAVLLDPTTLGVTASHCTRTRGDPVAATRECIRSLGEQVGDCPVGLVGTTGSARELIGAYVGTAHVYNEISAHAAGATHFDADVDTIFEIGGQDAKYIYLRNGVPVDYAMNNACSAGTGSFLEESAQGDLGITVSDIADIALTAPSPVQLKATCAAFINSEIRIAQQQGSSRPDLVAGLVYAIAGNFLTRVKGPRPVGKKVFLQGGVALNRAVGHAFAELVGRPVVIPPDPELLGALGVALLAVERAGGASHIPATRLLDLAAPELKRLGQFTCRACKLYCSIDRFEIANRRFPFGGRCSLFERLWKRTSRTAAAPDLVQRRAQLLFGETNGNVTGNGPHIGIPKALTTHSLYPLYSTFFRELGMRVVLSGVDPRGDLKSYSGFCFPVQIAHGAVLDLARRGVDLVFLPHVSRMPQTNACRDSYLCPITQAGPYFLAKAFPAVRFLSPQLDFTAGYASSSTLAEMAVTEMGFDRALAERAWQQAVRAQTEAETSQRELAQQTLERVVAANEPAILLAGHSYNAFSAEASQSVGKKLASMGVTAIPADGLFPVADGPAAWHFANQILNATALARRHPNLFLLCVSNFSCTVDAFTHSRLTSELGSKPFLILEIDAHTADGGVQTRLEAFLDIIRNYQEAQAPRGQAFTPCTLAADGRILTSTGERVSTRDPRVKIYAPNFSQLHSRGLAMATRWLGMHPGPVTALDRRHLDRGLRHSSGRECLPLPICMGQLLEIHEQRAPGEIAGVFMIRGGAPCVADAYLDTMQRFITEQQLDNVFLFAPADENNHAGLDSSAVARHVSAAILVADILVEIEHVLRVVGAEGAVERLGQLWRRFVDTATSFERFRSELPRFIDQLAALPRDRDPRTCPRILVTGDFFTRFSSFFIEGVRSLYARRGIILKPVDLSDLLLYSTYHSVAGTADRWGMKPGGLALAKACTRIFQPDGKQYLQSLLAYHTEQGAEARYRALFQRTGLLVTETRDFPPMFDAAAAHVSPAIYGEVLPTVGDGLSADREGYDGVLLIGPFNCLPYRVSEAILKPMSTLQAMPILTYESDGCAVSPSFLRQVDVHIQQVLDRAGRRGEVRQHAGRSQ